MAKSDDSTTGGAASSPAREPEVGQEGSASRRRFLARATIAMGGLMGAVMAVPVLRYLLYPVGKRIVRSPTEPIDVIGAAELKVGDHPRLVAVNADSVRDAWSVASAPLGAVWLRKVADDKVEALSSACPHLGCAIGYDAAAKQFKCPCHRSAFGVDGAKLSGPSKRGMDPLEAKIDAGGRVKVTFKRFRPDVADREEV